MTYDPGYFQFLDMTRRLFPQYLPMIPASPPMWPTPPKQSAPNAPPPVGDSNIIFVEGDAGAAAYQVPPGGKTVIFDARSDRVYVKSVDADGKPHTKYSEVDWQDFRAPDDPANRFVSIDDFNQFKADLKTELTAAIQQIAANMPAKAVQKEAPDNG